MNIRRDDQQDYYEILGVPPDATLREITNAYYSLALKHHPDVCCEDQDSSTRFKRISQAYEVLSDVKRRREYDRSHVSMTKPHTARTSQPPASSPIGRPLHRDSVQRPHAQRCSDLEVELPVVPEEARAGGPCEFILTLPQPCDRCRGGGRSGSGRCERCRGQGTIRIRRLLRIHLPGDVRDGDIFRLAETRGAAFDTALENLLIRIRIRPYW
ncbi:MAG: DnaJ domain-containing protein [Planctomycetes bacterium]|nr:DnaJ domain-containing protein [Planctomycetota bacterium]